MTNRLFVKRRALGTIAALCLPTRLAAFTLFSGGIAGLPAALGERMQGVSLEALALPVLLERFRQAGLVPWPATPADIAACTAEQTASLTPIIRAAGARIE